jgi:hypothetical protein
MIFQQTLAQPLAGRAMRAPPTDGRRATPGSCRPCPIWAEPAPEPLRRPGRRAAWAAACDSAYRRAAVRRRPRGYTGVSRACAGTQGRCRAREQGDARGPCPDVFSPHITSSQGSGRPSLRSAGAHCDASRVATGDRRSWFIAGLLASGRRQQTAAPATQGRRGCETRPHSHTAHALMRMRDAGQPAKWVEAAVAAAGGDAPYVRVTAGLQSPEAAPMFDAFMVGLLSGCGVPGECTMERRRRQGWK